jgi:hypothetical protein
MRLNDHKKQFMFLKAFDNEKTHSMINNSFSFSNKIKIDNHNLKEFIIAKMGNFNNSIIVIFIVERLKQS